MTDDIDRPMKRQKKRTINQETGYFDQAKKYGEELIDKAKNAVGWSGRNRKKKIDAAVKKSGG